MQIYHWRKGLIGPVDICSSYEQNMIEGRKKFDILEWGQSQIEVIEDSEYFVHFTDYLTKNDTSYTHRCKQRLSVNQDGLIHRIEHIHDEEEQERLDQFYRNVGLK